MNICIVTCRHQFGATVPLQYTITVHQINPQRTHTYSTAISTTCTVHWTACTELQMALMADSWPACMQGDSNMHAGVLAEALG